MTIQFIHTMDLKDFHRFFNEIIIILVFLFLMNLNIQDFHRFFNEIIIILVFLFLMNLNNPKCSHLFLLKASYLNCFLFSVFM